MHSARFQTTAVTASGTARTLRALLLVASVLVAGDARAQDVVAPVTPPPVEMRGAVTVTNNGVSLIPSFTLGRPATIVDLTVQRGAASFEPQLRFGIDGRPWSFLLWGRYQVVRGEKFTLTAGVHPAFVFRTVHVPTPEGSASGTEVNRFVAGEMAPSYAVTDRVAVGGQYLYSRGLQAHRARQTQFAAAHVRVGGVPLGRSLALQVVPQIFYLKMDRRDGTYASATATVARRGVPVAVSAMVSTPLRSDIAGGRGAVWNVSLTYAFR